MWKGLDDMGNAPRCPRCGSSNTRKSDERLLKGGLSFLGELAVGYGLGRLGLADVAIENSDELTLRNYLDDEFLCKDCGYVWKPRQSPTYIPQNQSENSQIDYAQDEITNRENQLFSDEFNRFFENEKSILSSGDSLRYFINKIDGIIKNQISDTIVKSEYRFLQAFACSEYLYYIDASDVDFAKIGERKIDSAIQYLNDDEYKVLKRVLHSYILDFGASDILSIQKTYDQKCPNIQSLQNTLIKTEYLEQIYNFSRFSSLSSTASKLEEKGSYKQAFDAYKLMLELDTINAYITASFSLYYCHSIEKDCESFWNEDKAFRYAKQGADYAIEFMKNNFDPEDQISKEWLFLVAETAARYMLGSGVNVDLKEAEKYALIGSNYGDEDCKKFLKDLYGGTNPQNSNQFEQSISENEDVYVEELIGCLENGVISDKERRLLNKLRERLGISEERAKELEASLSSPQLTETEQEYLNAYKEATADGEMSEKERRLLEKLRIMYGISEGRARELEK